MMVKKKAIFLNLSFGFMSLLNASLSNKDLG